MRAIRPLSPPTDLRPFEREDRILDRQHRGRVDRLALENALVELAAFGQAEELGQRPVGGEAFEPLDRARAEDQHAVPAFAAEHLLPAEGRDIDLVPRQVVGEHRAGRVGEAQARRGRRRSSRRRARGRPLVVPFQVNRTSFDQSTCGEVGQLAIIGADDRRDRASAA